MTKIENVFWKRVIKTPGCWLWTGTKQLSGRGHWYGVIRGMRPHRYSYEIHKGSIPKGLVIDHLCRTTLCVRPDHLEAVTSRENTMRGISPVALNAKKTKCGLCGNPFDHVRVNGKRGCRPCERKRDYNRYWSRKSTAEPAAVHKRSDFGKTECGSYWTGPLRKNILETCSRWKETTCSNCLRCQP